MRADASRREQTRKDLRAERDLVRMDLRMAQRVIERARSKGRDISRKAALE
jgi:hypothetical protein